MKSKSTIKKQSKPKKERTHYKTRVKLVNGKLIEYDVVEEFLKEVIKNGGNQAKAAMVVSPNIKESSKYIVGHSLMNQARKRGLVQSLLSKKGYNFGSMMDVAIEKMEKSKKPDWWDRLMKMAEYEDFTKSGKGSSINVSVFGAHNKIAESYIDGEVVSDEETIED